MEQTKPSDLTEPDYLRIIIQMIKLRDTHVREIKKLLDCPHHVAIQVEAQMRQMMPPLYGR